MNKKLGYLFLCLLLMFNLCACIQKENISNPTSTSMPTSTLVPTRTPVPTNTLIPTHTPIPTPTLTYQVEIVSLVDTDDVIINYIKITNWALVDKMQAWNDLFYNQVMEEKESLAEGDELILSCEIKEQTNDVLSIFIDGFYDSPFAAHPSSFTRIYNINMKTGDVIRLNDYTDTADVADAILNTHQYTLVGEDSVTLDDIWESQLLFGDVTTELLTTSLNHFGMDYESYGDNEVHGNFYIEDGKVCLVFDVNHAIGDYAILEMN